MAEEFFIPKLGQTVEEVTLVKWLVEDGAKVGQGQEVMEVETDKAVFPVEANAKGYIHIGPYKEGEVVPVLTVVAVIGKPEDKFEVRGRATASRLAVSLPPRAVAATAAGSVQLRVRCELREVTESSPRRAPESWPPRKSVDLAQVTPTGYGGVRVDERDVRGLSRSGAQGHARCPAHGCRGRAWICAALTGTGPGGRIVKEDVARAAQACRSPAIDLCQLSEVIERMPLKGVRGIIAERMGASVHTTARVTLVMEVDATEFVAARERIKAKVSRRMGLCPGLQ